MLSDSEIIKFWSTMKLAKTLIASDSKELKSLGESVRRAIMNAAEQYLLGDKEKADNEMQKVISLLFFFTVAAAPTN